MKYILVIILVFILSSCDIPQQEDDNTKTVYEILSENSDWECEEKSYSTNFGNDGIELNCRTYKDFTGVEILIVYMSETDMLPFEEHFVTHLRIKGYDHDSSHYYFFNRGKLAINTQFGTGFDDITCDVENNNLICNASLNEYEEINNPEIVFLEIIEYLESIIN